MHSGVAQRCGTSWCSWACNTSTMPSEHIPAALRRQVRARANGLCEYCRCPALFTNASYHCDHIRPREAGGETTLDNLAWACPWCNAHKYTTTHATDPLTKRRVPLFNPRRQRWSRHFAWSEDFVFIEGRRDRSGNCDGVAYESPRITQRPQATALGWRTPA